MKTNQPSIRTIGGSKIREHTRTHPWITFTIDLRRASPAFWMALGEAQSKCEHLAGVPLQPEIAKHLHGVYLAKGIQATTAIEGNTLSEEEVLERIDGKKTLPPSKEYMGQEIDNVLGAANEILEKIEQEEYKPLNLEMISAFNRQILNRLEVQDHVTPGEIRTCSVGVAGYRGAPAQDCQYLMEELCRWLESDAFRPPPEQRIAYGLIKAVVAHIYIAWIHPYGDGNGRTARLVEVKTLLEAGAPSVAGHLLSNHYNMTRTEYYRQLDRASKNGGNILPFIQYAVEGFVDQLREQIRLVKYQLWDVSWRNYIHELFRNSNSAADVRRRHLALAISMAKKAVPVKDLTGLTPKLAQEYASKTRKTLTRDLNALIELDLIKKTEDGYTDRAETILAFLPVRREFD